jgi:hypothetical protein
MAPKHKWTFTARFRSEAYGWRASALASKRLKEAVSEIRKVARKEPVVAADGAVKLMERIWPALQHVDSSSGALGNAVERTLEALIPLLIKAPADRSTREEWMDRLYDAVLEDGVDYLNALEEKWGDICVFEDLANGWAERLLPFILEAWADSERMSVLSGVSICLSCLLATRRYQELHDLLALRSFHFWSYDKFWAEALVRQGQVDEAIAYAEARLEHSYGEKAILRFCERVLLDVGRREEAYRRYALNAATGTTYLAIYRDVAKRYPERDGREILHDLIGIRGDKGKWFAAAKSAGCLDIALDCAREGTTDPATLARAARDFVETEPEFAAQVALLAIRSLLKGRGYEPTRLDIASAHRHLMVAADRMRATEWVMGEIQELLNRPAAEHEPMMRDELAIDHYRAQREFDTRDT